MHYIERGERVHDRGFLWGVTADPDLRQDADRPLPARGRAAQVLASARAREGDRVGALSALKRCLLLPEDEAAELGDAKHAAEVLLHDLGI